MCLYHVDILSNVGFIDSGAFISLYLNKCIQKLWSLNMIDSRQTTSSLNKMHFLHDLLVSLFYVVKDIKLTVNSIYVVAF